jgi:membrane protease YdiL (CAAX protease family)
VLAGIGAFIALFIVISIAIVGFAESRDDFASDDIGDPLEKANAVLVYADQRLAAAATGESMPAVPQVLANQDDLQFVLVGCVVAAYVGTALYAWGAEATGVSWLEPKSTLPTAVIRDDVTLTITGIVTLIGAPLSEEMFFRGLVFSGLLRWGFWPAAMTSGFLFSLVHFDPGSTLPFALIATLIAWVYWRRKSLWDAIAFHFFFNAASFCILVAFS